MLKRTISFVFILFSVFLFGQYPDKKKTSSMYLNKENITVKMEILDKKQTFIADKNIIYYWYASNNIMETLGGYEGKLLHGTYSSFYLSNNLREKGKFIKGAKNGEWISWYENGKIQEVSHWKKGKKSSWYKLYNEYGELMLHAYFKNNMLHGKMISYDGKNIISEKKYRNGVEVIKKEKQQKKKQERKRLNNLLMKLKKKDKNAAPPEKKKNTSPKVLSKTT